MPKIETHNLIVDFGKYKGERWTRVPASYLRWLANAPEGGANVDIAKAEIERRGTKIEGDIEVTPHAIDRASQNLLTRWKNTRHHGEGLYSWVWRMAHEAIKHCSDHPLPERITYKGIRFVFRHGRYFPVLKTVIVKNIFIKDTNS